MAVNHHGRPTARTTRKALAFRPGWVRVETQAGVPTAIDQPGGTLAVGGSAEGIWQDSWRVGDILYRRNQSDRQF